MSKKILSVIIALVVVFAMFIPTASAAITNPVSDTADWNIIVDGWFTAPDGGFKFNIGEWHNYGSYGIQMVESLTLPTNCCMVAVYEADPVDVFENKTQADFELVLQETITKFEKRTVGNSEFTMFYAETASYRNYVFQANGYKYFINFICVSDITEYAASVMDTIIIADDEAVPPPAREKFDVIYMLNGAEYARESYEVGATITPIADPEKEGYTFSGWSEIPEVMPAEDVIVEGTQLPETGDSTALITMGAVAVLAFVAIIASKKRATSK